MALAALKGTAEARVEPRLFIGRLAHMQFLHKQVTRPNHPAMIQSRFSD